jgi:tRNA (mo5U34)-methyltransferase
MKSRELREQVRQIGVEQTQMLLSGSWWHSIDLGNGQVTPGVHSLSEMQQLYQALELPEDMSGRSLLDIGCWDGFYTFETERHGARVTSVDCWRPSNFFAAREVLNSKAEFHELNVYDIRKDKLTAFDIVLFMGVLYHLRHPLLALERVCEVTRDFAIIESHIIDKMREADEPVMEFYEFDELGGQYDNWWAPNVECMAQMARSAGFARVEMLYRTDTRAALKAYRKWNDKPEGIHPGLVIRDVINATTFAHRFPRSGQHSFLSIWVEGLPKTARRWDTRVEVGGFGIHPTYVGPPGDPQYSNLTQINAPMPPGLNLGQVLVHVWHDGKLSNDFAIELIEGSPW